MNSSLRIIVTGLIAQYPLLGGITWHYLQYVVGLVRLGHEVYYLEDSGEWPYNLDGGPSGNDWVAKDCVSNVDYLAEVMSRFGLDDRWAYRFPLKSQWFGLSDQRRMAVVESADLLINVSGTLEHPERYRHVPRLGYIDTDPVFTQINLAQGQTDRRERVDAHDVHFSFGESFSESVPATGHQWHPTRQPIVLSEWHPASPRRQVFTTVMNWISYKSPTYGGQTFGQKDVELKRFLELPRKVRPNVLEVALFKTRHDDWQTNDPDVSSPQGQDSPDVSLPSPYELLVSNGWRVVDAGEVCGDFDSYRGFIESSMAEWSVAKNGYVVGQPGWFSERSACYLAAGRPVVVQDTGLAAVLPVGEGILPFRTMDEAVVAIYKIETDYKRQAAAARAIAEQFFDSDTVLGQLLERVFA